MVIGLLSGTAVFGVRKVFCIPFAMHRKAMCIGNVQVYYDDRWRTQARPKVHGVWFLACLLKCFPTHRDLQRN